MNFIKSRLRRLEESGHGHCPECYQKLKTMLAYYPEQGESAPEAPTCLSCSRPLAYVMRVVYDGNESEAKGGGG